MIDVSPGVIWEKKVYKLIIEDDEGHTTVVPLVKDEITIGRKEGNTIRLTERNVSRHHARLLRSNGSFFIEDLDSYNGVKVNGDRITNRTTVREGDLVEIGDYHLALQKVSEKEVSGPPAVPQEKPVLAAQMAAPADGATALLKLPVDQMPVAEKGRLRSIPDEQAARLEVITTELKGQQFLLNRTEMTLGRTEESDIVLAHRSVSAVHAKIVFDGGVYRILDLDSANGVLVNGEEYVRVDLRRGDVIELGHVKLRFIAPGERSEAAVPEPLPKAVHAEPEILEGVPRRGFNKWLLLAGIPLLAAIVLFFVFRPRQIEGPPEGEKVGSEEVIRSSQPQAATAEAADLYREGLNRYSEGDFAGALAKLEALNKINPEYTGLSSLLEKVRQAERDNNLLAQARAAVDQSDFDSAWELYNRIGPESHLASEIENEKGEVRKKYITLHLNKGKRAAESRETRELALRELKKVLDVDPGNTRAEELLKKIKRSEKPVAVAEVRPSEPAQRKPTVRNAWDAAGVTLAGVRNAIVSKNFRAAISDLEKVFKINPRDCEALIWLGAAHAHNQQKTLAVKYYRQFVASCPFDKRLPQIRDIVKKFEESTAK